MCNQQKLLEYIAIHDAPCPNCLANLRGQVEDVCPVCDCRLFLGSVCSFHLAFGDSKSEPVCRPKLSHRERVAEYLAKNDAPCPGCFRNLRGQPDMSCPACRHDLYFKELVSAHRLYGDSGLRPMPAPGSAESQRLDAYLAGHNVGCQGCGYELHGLVSDACPECGGELVLAALMYPDPGPVRVNRATVNTLTTFSAAPVVLMLLVMLTGFTEMYSAYELFVHVASMLVLALLLYAFVIPGRRAMLNNLGWALLYNPLTAIVGMYIVGMAMYVALHY